eukprot:CAMPEP_0170610482 /NCGR_PEP_ID=MMETSP0224-20130122/22683_1 /TAXON_ID=285029 /ORGANISM="Togula jolla, Strain CCCM 725" /LENGTH=136 /DNA_ID=CAMNT_0010935861 /DNA_START=50 /DNA_END=460 /DNA_ORIENTATION=+
MDKTQLQQACAEAGAVYAVFWAFDQAKGVLKATMHYNPPERLAQIKAMTGSDTSFASEAYKYEFTPGKGAVGQVYSTKEPVSFEDVTTLPADTFLRADVAAKYGIKSVAMKFFNGGVLEIGNTDVWSSFDWVNSDV